MKGRNMERIVIIGGAWILAIGVGVLTGALCKVSSDADDRAEAMRDQEWIAAAKQRAAESRARAAHPCARPGNVIAFPSRRPYDWQTEGV